MNYDFFILDTFFNDDSEEIFMLAKVSYNGEFEKFIATKIEYFFARYVNNIYVIFENGLVFESDFDDFILCYGEELGVPLDKEVVQFEIKTN